MAQRWQVVCTFLLETFKNNNACNVSVPTYENPQSTATVQRWFEEAKQLDIEVGRWDHLVGSERKLG